MRRHQRVAPGRRFGVIVAVAVVVVAALAAGGELRGLLDRWDGVDETRLMGALLTFRPSPQSGAPEELAPGDLGPDKTTRGMPARCAPLTQLALGTPVGAASWTGVNGAPARPVRLLTVRFADAGEARAEMRAKRWAALTCSQVDVTFPPFDAAPRAYRVSDHGLPWFIGSDTLSYQLTGDGKTFEFYVRRYGNTLTWTYADDVSTPALRHQVADALVRRLDAMRRER